MFANCKMYVFSFSNLPLPKHAASSLILVPVPFLADFCQAYSGPQVSRQNFKFFPQNFIVRSNILNFLSNTFSFSRQNIFIKAKTNFLLAAKLFYQGKTFFLAANFFFTTAKPFVHPYTPRGKRGTSQRRTRFRSHFL